MPQNDNIRHIKNITIIKCHDMQNFVIFYIKNYMKNGRIYKINISIDVILTLHRFERL